MKFLNLFRNKLFVSLVAVGVAVIIITASVLSIMLPSYISWKEYYEAVLAEREEQKRVQSLPLELLGISAELAENVTYYDNGKAAPVNGDFNVRAHFTEKGKEFDEILEPNAFEISVPENFRSKGGNVQISYTFTPEAKEEETPESVVKTAEVVCSLEKVMPVSISLKETPYRVYYADNMAFDAEGMKATVKFNDGSTELVGAKEFSAAEENLTVGTEKIDVEWHRGGTELSLEVPVKVVPAAEYDDGYVIAVRPEGTVYLEPGALTSEAMPAVRGTYESGNRLLLTSDKCTVKGNTERASYYKKCILTVLLKDDPNIFHKTAAIVKSGLEAETAVTEHTTVGEVNDENGKVTVVTPENGGKISFNIEAETIFKPDMTMRVAVKAEAAKSVIALADVMTMTVNGRAYKIPGSTMLSTSAAADEEYLFVEVSIPAPVLNAGTANKVEFAFKGEDCSKLLIDRFSLESGYKGTFYASTEEYLVSNAASGTSTQFDYEIVKPFGGLGGKPYSHSICSDGTYLYIVGTSWQNPTRNYKVQKYDPVANKEIAVSAETEQAGTEEAAGITYYDGKIIIYFADGRQMYCNVEDFKEGCEFVEYEGFKFEGLNDTEATKNTLIKDVYFNSTKQMFAVYSGAKVYLFDRQMKFINDFDIPAHNGNARRLIGSADYIYISYTKDGLYSPSVSIFDWNGELVGKMSVPVSGDFLLSNGVSNLDKTNIQGMAVINGDYYAVLLRFNGDDAAAYVKITMPEISEELEPDLGFWEYLNACDDAEVTPAFTASPSAGTYGEIAGSPNGYAMGGVSDGEYLYVSINTAGNSATTICKVDKNYKTVEKSAQFTVGSDSDGGDNSRLFIKDGKLYCVAIGVVYSLELEEFAEGCVMLKDDAMTEMLTKNTERTLKASYWSESQQKYASIDYHSTDEETGAITVNSKLYITDAEGELIGVPVQLEHGNMKGSSVYCDDNYIYVTYTVNYQSDLPIDVFDWEGNKVTSYSVKGINLGDAAYNIQAIYEFEGKLHACVCSWTAGFSCFHDFTIRGDLTVFNSTVAP